MSEVDFTHHAHIVLWNDSQSYQQIGELVERARENPIDNEYMGDIPRERRVRYTLGALLKQHIEDRALDKVDTDDVFVMELMTGALDSIDTYALAEIALDSFRVDD